MATSTPDSPPQHPGDIAGPEHQDSEWVTIAKTLAREFGPTAVERERAGILPTAELQQLRDSRLVNLLIPSHLGGEGGTFADAIRVVVELSKADASIGALLGFHYYVSMVPRLYDFVDDAAQIQRRSAEHRWLWANVHQPQQADFLAAPDGAGGFVINGRKRWSTGVTLADVTTVIAHRTDSRELLVAVIPTDRAGLSFQDDWDHLGLRLAETVTADFKDVQVGPEEVVGTSDGSPQVSLPPYYTSFAMSAYGAILIGAAWAALERSRQYVLERTKPRLISNGDLPRKDPLTQAIFGGLLGKVSVAQALVYRVADEVQDAFERRLAVPARERARIGVRAYAARAAAAEAALDTTSRVYDMTSVSAGFNSWGLDRHWRDVRILTVHDPIVTSLAAAGDFYLNGNARELPAFIS